MWSEWLNNIQWFAVLKVSLEFFVLVGFIYYLYNRFARQTQADRLLRGLFVLLTTFVILWGLFHLLNLPLLETVFGASIQLLIIGLIVIFQPELRKLLVALGQADLFPWQETGKSVVEGASAHRAIKCLRDAVKFMAKTKTGALIVLEPADGQTSPSSYLEAGVSIDATISAELLMTIFHPNTPLHDGAVVIDAQCKVMAAGVLLPLTEEPNLSWRYGTRHRAAIGLTETSPSHCLVVSEETGSVSYVAAGAIHKIGSMEELSNRLHSFYGLANTETASAETVEDKPSVLKGSRVGHLINSLEETLPTRLQQLLQATSSKES